ncbi:uncharacterized protein LOC132713560 [Ruditapes philippinarum]|uniref:uncharacterized protein LOC132713560 n=1 Tax=Ruditapes philippinarum TaxID=129788 RepID=UPI00295B7945|nr:uncharacterized protein LOC132713560 [Ruditapes philippinarum]
MQLFKEKKWIWILEFVIFFVFKTVLTHKFTQFTLSSSNARYSDNLVQHFNTSIIQCARLCNCADECTSINHKADTGVCELTTYVPGVVTPSTETESNWNVYYDDRFVPAVNAWQKSTHFHVTGPLVASFAIDGNRDNNDNKVTRAIYCAHSAYRYSYWGMEFERFAEVSHVIIFFRNASHHNYRNSNLRLLISATRQDSDNNIGTDCAYYVGPPASSSLPVKIPCAQHVTGKFLKIIHNQGDVLCLCEVEVYSV